MLKQFLYVVSLFLLTCIVCGAFIVYGTEQVSANAIERKQYYFNDGLSMHSDETDANTEILEDCIKQIVFETVIGEDVIKTGVVFPNEFSSDSLNEHIDETINEINDQYNSSIGYDDLNLFCIETEEDNTQTLSEMDTLEMTNLKEVITINNIITKEQIETIEAFETTGEINEQKHIRLSNMLVLYNSRTNAYMPCRPTLSSPHVGDGNNRYDIGYQWFPGKARVEFSSFVWTAPKNQVDVNYSFTEKEIENLIVDDNEVLEIEIVFYNYNSATDPDVSVEDFGYSFVDLSADFTWSTNQPMEYLDTSFADSAKEVSLCIGVADASALEPNKSYYYVARCKPGESYGYPHDGDLD
ncbi:hypothetical protein [Ruminococcus gauvreauii]|uniref:hypothetical protein n=1 Tax=Ruminococcus gauvreauii TaxID=438033 RepID=UPI003983ED33